MMCFAPIWQLLLPLIRISYSEWMMALPVILSEDNCAKDYLARPLTPMKAEYGTKTTVSAHMVKSHSSFNLFN